MGWGKSLNKHCPAAKNMREDCCVSQEERIVKNNDSTTNRKRENQRMDL